MKIQDSFDFVPIFVRVPLDPFIFGHSLEGSHGGGSSEEKAQGVGPRNKKPCERRTSGGERIGRWTGRRAGRAFDGAARRYTTLPQPPRFLHGRRGRRREIRADSLSPDHPGPPRFRLNSGRLVFIGPKS